MSAKVEVRTDGRYWYVISEGVAYGFGGGDAGKSFCLRAAYGGAAYVRTFGPELEFPRNLGPDILSPPERPPLCLVRVEPGSAPQWAFLMSHGMLRLLQDGSVYSPKYLDVVCHDYNDPEVVLLIESAEWGTL
jgi:hypothetical protein